MGSNGAPTAEARPEAGTATFYRYRDVSGRSVIVDSLSRVPAPQRASAEVIALAPSVTGAASESSATHAVRALTAELHLPSFIAGASSGLACGLLLFVLGRKFGRWLKGALVFGFIGALALGATAYFGWVRRTAGQGEELLASPATLIDDARTQVEKMNRRSQEQQRVLEELEQVR